MNRRLPIVLCRVLGLVILGTVAAQDASTPTLARHPKAVASPVLHARVGRAVEQTLLEFAPRNLSSDQIAMTVVDLSEPSRPQWGSYRGGIPIYPASVVKLFYLVAAEQALEEGRIRDTPELQRALRDMIVDSANEATHLVVDVLTGTTSGPELSEPELKDWFDRRNAVNRFFEARGYVGINANKKPWCEGPYGREKQAIERFEPKRNTLTTEATARLLTEIVTGTAASGPRTLQMLDWMKRDVHGPVQDPEDQTHGFVGIALRDSAFRGSRLWSKAGWTSQTRHDAAYVETADGRRWVFVVFTVGHAHERDILPALVRPFLKPVH